MAEKEAADKDHNKDTIAAFMAFIKQGKYIHMFTITRNSTHLQTPSLLLLACICTKMTSALIILSVFTNLILFT